MIVLRVNTPIQKNPSSIKNTTLILTEFMKTIHDKYEIIANKEFKIAFHLSVCPSHLPESIHVLRQYFRVLFTVFLMHLEYLHSEEAVTANNVL